MPRSRSGSFYCPLEPACGPLSIAQKAALSTAHPYPQSALSLPAGSESSSPAPKRHVRTPSFDGAVSINAPSSVTLPPASLRLYVSPIRVPSQAQASPSSHVHSRYPHYQSICSAKRYPWTPERPSPLRRLASDAPLCPSALWTTHKELLPLYNSNSSSTSPSSLYTPRKPRPLSQSVLRNAFLSSPRGEKVALYGLRVAWCVFGDVKDILSAPRRAPPRPSTVTPSPVAQPPVVATQDDALTPPPPTRSRLRREQSFIWEDVPPISSTDFATSPDHEDLELDIAHIEHHVSNHLEEEDGSSSEYSSDSDDEEEGGDTESASAESSDLDLDFELDLDLGLDLADLDLGELDEEEDTERSLSDLLRSERLPRVNGRVANGDTKRRFGSESENWHLVPFRI